MDFFERSKKKSWINYVTKGCDWSVACYLEQIGAKRETVIRYREITEKKMTGRHNSDTLWATKACVVKQHLALMV